MKIRRCFASLVLTVRRIWPVWVILSIFFIIALGYGTVRGWSTPNLINSAIALFTFFAAVSSAVSARASQCMSDTMLRDYSERARPYIGIEDPRIEACLDGQPHRWIDTQSHELLTVTRENLKQCNNLTLRLTLRVKNFGSVPALLRPIGLTFSIGGRQAQPKLSKREETIVVFPGSVGAIRADFDAAADVSAILGRPGALTFTFHADYSRLGSEEWKYTELSYSYNFDEHDFFGGIFLTTSGDAV